MDLSLSILRRANRYLKITCCSAHTQFVLAEDETVAGADYNFFLNPMLLFNIEKWIHLDFLLQLRGDWLPPVTPPVWPLLRLCRAERGDTWPDLPRPRQFGTLPPCCKKNISVISRKNISVISRKKISVISRKIISNKPEIRELLSGYAGVDYLNFFFCERCCDVFNTKSYFKWKSWVHNRVESLHWEPAPNLITEKVFDRLKLII